MFERNLPLRKLLKQPFVYHAASNTSGSVPPLRLKIAMTAPKTSTLAKTDNKLKSDRFPDFTNGGFKGHSINRVAAPALDGYEPTLTNAATFTNDCIGNCISLAFRRNDVHTFGLRIQS
jgi:hypothetical protein